MSGHDSRDPRAAALSRVVREARDQSAPDLDWSSMEERLLQKAARAVPQPVKRFPQPLAWGALAVAAGAVVWFVTSRSPSGQLPLSQADVAAQAPSVRDGDSLAIGSRVETSGSEALVMHPGRAQWTLAPNSSAVLAGRDERVTVHLERGSVLSKVVPNPKPETFVVEAAGTRIAVHGTLFRVALAGGRVIVDVQEGLVGVGPLGSAPTFFVKGASHADFAADGRSGSIDGQPVGSSAAHPTEALKQPAERGSNAAASSSVPAPATSAELPDEPSINDIEIGIARIVDATSACFSRYTPAAEGVEITVRTALSLKILESGEVADVDFQPPLSPPAAECAATSIAQVRFAPSKQGGEVTRMLELKR